MGHFFCKPEVEHPYTCKMCTKPRSFAYYKDWKVHMDSVHPPLKCLTEQESHFEDTHDTVWCDACFALGKRGDEVMVPRKDWGVHRTAHLCEHSAVRGVCYQCRYTKPAWATSGAPGFHVCFIGYTCTGKTSCWKMYADKKRPTDPIANTEKEGEQTVVLSRHVVTMHDNPGISPNTSNDTYVAKCGLRYADAVVMCVDSTSPLLECELSVLRELLNTGLSSRIIVVAGKVDTLVGGCSTLEEVHFVVEGKVSEIRHTIHTYMKEENQTHINVVPLWQGTEDDLNGMATCVVDYLGQTRAHLDESIVETMTAERGAGPRIECCRCKGDTRRNEACFSFSNCRHLCVCEVCSAHYGTGQTVLCPRCGEEGTLKRIFLQF